jgi:hypothetical protein
MEVILQVKLGGGEVKQKLCLHSTRIEPEFTRSGKQLSQHEAQGNSTIEIYL